MTTKNTQTCHPVQVAAAKEIDECLECQQGHCDWHGLGCSTSPTWLRGDNYDYEKGGSKWTAEQIEQFKAENPNWKDL